MTRVLESRVFYSIESTPNKDTEKPYFHKKRNFANMVEYFGDGNIPTRYLPEHLERIH